MSGSNWSWVALGLLGAYHGINPGMGWLFAVGRGLQERRRSAVLGSLLPIAIGHELSVVAVVLGVLLTQQFAPPHLVRLLAALALAGFGLATIVRPRRHPRGFGMRVGPARLGLWSFVMSSAHGAGLMLVPVLFGLPVMASYVDLRELSLTALLASGVHVAAMLTVMGVVAVVVYERLGLRLLRRGWFNLDLAWSGALLVSGVATLFTA